MAMESKPVPEVSAVPAVPVLKVIGVIDENGDRFPLPSFTTRAVDPSGVMAMAVESVPTLIEVPSMPLEVATGVTELDPTREDGVWTAYRVEPSGVRARAVTGAPGRGTVDVTEFVAVEITLIWAC